jgi:hypothetical protein
MLFPNNVAVFQDDIAPLHTAGGVQSWSVLETGLWNRFPPPTSLKQLENVLQEEWYAFLLGVVENLYEFNSESVSAATEGKSWSNTILIKKHVE